MQRAGALRAAIEWNVVNTLTWAKRWLDPRYLRVRYEDVASDPRRSVSRILRFLDESPNLFQPAEDDRMFLGANHTVSGNPMRFQEGTIAIRPDDAWRTRMQRRDRIVVSVLTWPARVWLGMDSRLRTERVTSPGVRTET